MCGICYMFRLVQIQSCLNISSLSEGACLLSLMYGMNLVVILMVAEMVVKAWQDWAKNDGYRVVVLTFVRIATLKPEEFWMEGI